jgi:hypothetical protein
MVEFHFKDMGGSPNLGLRYTIGDLTAKTVLGLTAAGAATAGVYLRSHPEENWVTGNIAMLGAASASVGTLIVGVTAYSARRLAFLKQHTSRQEQLAKQIVLRLKADREASIGKYLAASMTQRTLKFYQLHPLMQNLVSSVSSTQLPPVSPVITITRP